MLAHDRAFIKRKAAMTFDLTGKTALVTAAAQGIGRAVAECFRDAGAAVTAVDINADALTTLEGCTRRRLDVTDLDGIGALAAELGHVDVLFNCAGVVHNGSILDCTDHDWDFAVALNMTAAMRMIRAFLPAMLAGRGGSIVNVASVASSILGVPNRFAYGTTKAAYEVGCRRLCRARDPVQRNLPRHGVLAVARSKARRDGRL